MILYMYFVLKIAGSNRAIHKMILEMIKHFTLLIWLNTLIYYRLRTLGGNLLHWNLSPWLSAVCVASSIATLSSLSSPIPLLFMSKLQRERKSLKNMFISGYAGSLYLACVYALQTHCTCVLVRSVSQRLGAYPCKGQKARVSSLKSYLWSLLEPSRRVFDVYWAPPDGSCTPMIEELIPSREELPHPKEGVSHWCWNWITSSRIL